MRLLKYLSISLFIPFYCYSFEVVDNSGDKVQFIELSYPTGRTQRVSAGIDSRVEKQYQTVVLGFYGNVKVLEPKRFTHPEHDHWSTPPRDRTVRELRKAMVEEFEENFDQWGPGDPPGRLGWSYGVKPASDAEDWVKGWVSGHTNDLKDELVKNTERVKSDLQKKIDKQKEEFDASTLRQLKELKSTLLTDCKKLIKEEVELEEVEGKLEAKLTAKMEEAILPQVLQAIDELRSELLNKIKNYHP